MNTIPVPSHPRPLWRRLLRRALRIFLFVLIVLVAGLVLRCFYAFRDRNPGYQISLDINGHQVPTNQLAVLQVGFARVKINPELRDANRPVYLAGFSQNRLATKIHDDLWAIACVVDDGRTRVGFVEIGRAHV